MKILRRVLFIFLLIAAIMVVAGYFLPTKAYVERKIEINALPETVYRKLNTMKSWEKWSPWYNDDSTTRIVYTGPESGIGSGFSFTSSNKNIVSYSVSIISSIRDKSVMVLLDFGSNGKSVGKFDLERINENTAVTWSVESNIGNNPLSRWVALFTDRLVGPDLERGLFKLHEEVKETQLTDSYEIAITDVSSTFLLTMRDTASPAELSGRLGNMYYQLSRFLKSKNISPTGSPIVIYHKYSSQIFDIEAGIPVLSSIDTPDNIACIQTEAQKAIVLKYYGSYDTISNAYKTLQSYIRERSLEVCGPAWEEFVTETQTQPDSNLWQTNIYIPVK